MNGGLRVTGPDPAERCGDISKDLLAGGGVLVAAPFSQIGRRRPDPDRSCAGKQRHRKGRMALAARRSATLRTQAFTPKLQAERYRHDLNDSNSISFAAMPRLRPPAAQTDGPIQNSTQALPLTQNFHNCIGHSPNCHQAIAPYGGRIQTCPPACDSISNRKATFRHRRSSTTRSVLPSQRRHPPGHRLPAPGSRPCRPDCTATRSARSTASWKPMALWKPWPAPASMCATSRNPEIKTPPHIRQGVTDLDREVRKCVDGLLNAGRTLQQTRELFRKLTGVCVAAPACW